MRAKRAAGDTKINNVPFRLKSPKWNAGIPPFLRKERDKKQKSRPSCSGRAESNLGEIANASHGVETRFSEFLLHLARIRRESLLSRRPSDGARRQKCRNESSE